MHQGRPHTGEEWDYVPGEEGNPTSNPTTTSGYDWTIGGNQGSGFMTMMDLLPEGITDPYDITPFADLFGAEFDTSLLDITKQAGRQSIFDTIESGQTSYMQVPSDTAVAGAGGFGEAGGGSRGLVTAEGAQRGLFGDVFESMLGAKKADITALESLKDRAFNMFSDIQLDLDFANGANGDNGDNGVVPGGDEGDSLGDTTGNNDRPTWPGEPNEIWTSGNGHRWIYNNGTWSYVGQVGGNGGNGESNPPSNPPPIPPGPTGTVSGGGGCFLADTRILSGDGSHVPIQDIKKGMEVYAYDEESGELKVSKVSKTFFHPKENTYLVINNNLLVTPNHPVLNNNKWVEIGKLKEGDMLTDKDNNPIEIKNIEEVDELADVFNFEVEKYHTYVAEGVIVHNKGEQDPGGGGGDSGGGDFGDDYFWPTGP